MQNNQKKIWLYESKYSKSFFNSIKKPNEIKIISIIDFAPPKSEEYLFITV